MPALGHPDGVLYLESSPELVGTPLEGAVPCGAGQRDERGDVVGAEVGAAGGERRARQAGLVGVGEPGRDDVEGSFDEHGCGPGGSPALAPGRAVPPAPRRSPRGQVGETVCAGTGLSLTRPVCCRMWRRRWRIASPASSTHAAPPAPGQRRSHRRARELPVRQTPRCRATMARPARRRTGTRRRCPRAGQPQRPLCRHR
jgi:hypothetical protein